MREALDSKMNQSLDHLDGTCPYLYHDITKSIIQIKIGLPS